MTNSEPPVSGKRIKGEPAMRGLPTLARAREERRSRSAPLWNWLGPLVLVVLVIGWRVDAMRTGELRSGLLARQREVVQRLGSRWFPLRDRVEAWTGECAAPSFAELANPTLAATWDFRGMSGIYLRIAKENAATPAKIRTSSRFSLHDGFTSCLLNGKNPSPVEGAKCESTQTCAVGEQCNEFNQCAAPSQPYNLRTAYRVTYVLSDEWLTEIQATQGDLALRGAVSAFDALEKYDLQLATDLIAKAAFFMAVVDEPIEGGDAPVDSGAGGAGSSDGSVPTGPHQARVCVWRLDSGAKVLAFRGQAAGELMGGHPLSDEVRLARQRQAQSCGLALDVRAAIGDAAAR